MAKRNDKRRYILSQSEINELYCLPRLNNVQREQCFSLTDEELSAVNQQFLLGSKLYFILLLGYFREKPVIAQFHFGEVKEDLKYVIDRYYPGQRLPRKDPSQSQVYYLRKKLLDRLHYRNLDGKLKINLENYLADVATICAEPRYLFDECLAFLARERIALPRYSVIQKLVSLVLTAEYQRIEAILTNCLREKTKRHLADLLSSSDSITRLGRLKRPAKDFSIGEINREIESHKELKNTYPEAKVAIKKLGLSPRNLEYYCGLVNYYSVTKLRRFSPEKSGLYLLCYIYFRYQKINDNLIAAFGYWTRKHKEAAKNHGKNCALADVDLLMDNLKPALPLLQMYIDNKILDDTQFGTIRRKGFMNISKPLINDLCHHIEQSDLDKAEYRWTYCDKNIAKIRNNLRDVFLCLDLDFSDTENAFAKQIELAHVELSSFRKIQSVDKRAIPKKLKPYLIKQDIVDINRYEWYLYQRLNQSIIKGEVYVTESEKHKRLEDDLISEKDWKNSAKWIKMTGLPKLSQPIDSMLRELESQFQLHIDTACHGITQGDNRFVVMEDKAGVLKWSVPVKKSRDSINNPFFDQLPLTSVISVMAYVDGRCNFTNSFEHIAKDKEKKTVSKTDLLACIFANATNYGLGKIATISDRSFATLRHTENSYVRLENVHNSNDTVANAISELPIFQHYNIEDDRLYASIDGQKYETRINTFKARYSSKYFKDKGVSAMTLSCNHVALNTTVIGANEYEGHYAFDLLYNNTTDIQPDILSSDTHGTNQVNFALLDLFGYTFAPRYAKFKRVFYDMFVIDGNVKSGEQFIKLRKEINHDLIVDEWDQIQRIICSLARKKVTQSTLIKKLSTLSKSNKTLAALREYDRLVKANYLLSYLDDQELRRFVQQALNKGEAYHQLRRKVASVNGEKFRGGNDSQVELWNDCARLISNCIIYYNSAILSNLLARVEKMGNSQAKEILCRLSPVAWQRINLNGVYEFEGHERIELERLLRNVSTDSSQLVEV
jgi:TnpA family transposase